DGDGLETCDGARHVDERPLRRACGVAPVVRPLGPEHPGAGVRLPLGGHPEAIGGRGFGEGLRHGAGGDFNKQGPRILAKAAGGARPVRQWPAREARGPPAPLFLLASPPALPIPFRLEESLMSTAAAPKITPPAQGRKITIQNGKL